MDPLDVMLDMDQLLPYYKAIVSADTQMIIGYEVIAYFQNKHGKLQRMDWFFDDVSIPDEFRIEVNTYLQRKAIENKLEKQDKSFLSFYYDADLLVRNNGEALLAILEEYQSIGLKLNEIILEVKDTAFPKDMDQLSNLIKYLKTLGVKVSIQLENPNGILDQLATLHPNVLKVDTSFLKDDLLPHLYKDVYHAISMLSRKIGASLLFKGINNYNQFNYAWRSGGQYYQGRYLIHPQNDFVEVDSCKSVIQVSFKQFVTYERKKGKAQLELLEKIHATFTSILTQSTLTDNYDEFILNVGKACKEFAFRVYICNEEGIQLSSNAEKDQEDTWKLVKEGLNKNWSWRPYFFENVMRMNLEKKGLLSDLYTDIDKSELIRTYSYPLTDGRYIFLDIPYRYLFEQEGLL
ncbi:EAL domain-containing protein [Oceanobacillus kimchii]|uniref:EAL domain-containing protein n=1 Tax=Oceanobacillus kimchii TaxID=746691 RepID=UPI0003472BDB|nr:EAL domain-containing protein [Oceanobacillus kimchii]MCT1575505.1 EAL domain-containing protein [Oceanobacillus kimchii]MCT2138078.1 EAL domain-containing protein [Oceanobacillus kimchii]